MLGNNQLRTEADKGKTDCLKQSKTKHCDDLRVCAQGFLRFRRSGLLWFRRSGLLWFLLV